PLTSTRPPDGRNNPATRCSTVDFPAPFGPSRPVMPEPIVHDTALTATTLPYHRDTSCSSMVAVIPPTANTGTARLPAPPLLSPASRTDTTGPAARRVPRRPSDRRDAAAGRRTASWQSRS